MPNVGPLELVVVLIIALVVLGPKRLPEVGRSLGNGIREFKDSLTMEHSDDDHLDVADVEEPPRALTASAATAPVAPPVETAVEASEPAEPAEAADKPRS
jgi:sec-independent protein translocase protein TatA